MHRILLVAATVLMGLGCTSAFAMPRWESQGQRATHALNLLEARGYGGFSDFHAVGHDFAAMINQNGKTLQLLVHPGTDQIQVQT